MYFILLGIITGLLTGIMMTIQGTINSALADKVGTFGSVFIVTIVNLVLVGVIILFFPSSTSFRNLPPWHSWYLYLGGVLGVFILASIILIIPRYGATQGFIYIISGQLVASLVIDNFGYLGVEKTPLNATRIVGVTLFILGAYLVNLSKIRG